MKKVGIPCRPGRHVLVMKEGGGWGLWTISPDDVVGAGQLMGTILTEPPRLEGINALIDVLEKDVQEGLDSSPTDGDA